MIMAVMEHVAEHKEASKLLDAVPLLNAWQTVARKEIAFFAFVTFPISKIISALGRLKPSKAQEEHLQKLEKVRKYSIAPQSTLSSL